MACRMYSAAGDSLHLWNRLGMLLADLWRRWCPVLRLRPRGQEAVASSLPALLGAGWRSRWRVCRKGEDPDSLIRGQGAEAFRKALKLPKIFSITRVDTAGGLGAMDDPNRKPSAAKRLGPFVAAIKDNVLRETTAKTSAPASANPRIRVRHRI